MARIVTSMLCVLAAAALACGGNAHLTESHGRSYSAAFGKQAPPPAKITPPSTGLDSQEASIVAGSYRRSLATRAGAPGGYRDSPVLLLSPPKDATGAQLPPPSVPK